MSPPLRAAIAILLGALALTLLILLSPNHQSRSAHAPSTGWTTLSCRHMATTISITVPNDHRAEQALRILSDTFEQVDRDMSEWKETSPLSAVNANAGTAPAPVPPDLLQLIQRSIRLAETTHGAFDPTWAALWGLWDFKAPNPTIPDPADIERAASLVDYTRIQIDTETSQVYLPDPGMLIGLGGIAKGYAIDLTVDRLRDAGFTDFMILAGGQVYAAGRKGNRPWSIGIRDPRGAPEDYFARIDLHDASASTSGDYERFFIIDDTRYHHILDPRTGWPSQGPRSVTVVSTDATLADAMSTALMILDPDQRSRVMQETDLDWALIVDQNAHITRLGDADIPLDIIHQPHPR